MRYLLLCLALASCASTDKVTRHAQDDTSKLSEALTNKVQDETLYDAKPSRWLLGLLPAKKPKPVAAGYTFGKKSTVIIQTGTGNTAANATKPGTMATGTGATAVDAEKAKSPVQTGTGNAATDNTKAGQRNGSAATGAGSTASNETRKGGTPWYVWLAVAVGGAAAGWVLRGKASVWNWWPSWARPG